MKQFILCDLLNQIKILKAQSVETERDGNLKTDNDFEKKIEQINSLLKDAENKAIHQNEVGQLNPHINVLLGAKWKVLVKRCIRKLIWWFIQPIVVYQNWHTGLSKNIDNELRDSISLLKDIVLCQQKQINEVQQEIVKLRESSNELIKQSEEENIQKINAMQQEISELCENLKDDSPALDDYVDYLEFENTFRGSQEEIRGRLIRYLPMFKSGEKVLDLGCGRGEWLGLLCAQGIYAEGVDINLKFIDICKQKQLNVIQDDLFTHLEQQPDQSLDGITAIQVIEHMSPAELAKLMQICYKKLAFGGRLIFETQNPAVVSTMTTHFYVDPTHIRPVHPEWVKYLFEKNWFSDVILEYPSYAWVTKGSIPSIQGDTEEIKIFNQKITYLNNLLYGSTDYSIMGVKK